MARREKRLTKREKKAIGGSGGTFEERARAQGKIAGVSAVHFGADDEGRPPMSEVLREWGAPLLAPHADDDVETYARALSLVSLVWNAATMGEDPAGDVADGVYADTAEMDMALPPQLRPKILEMIEARRRAYEDDPRVVIVTDALDVDGERRVKVAWSVL